MAADVWSATSFTELRRDGLAAERWNLLHPEDKPKQPYVTQCLEKRTGPVVAASDYMKAFADQIRPFVPRDRVYKVLGTDGFGRSDSRAKLRHFFEVNRYFVAIAALKALAETGEVKAKTVTEAIKKYGIDPEQAGPRPPYEGRPRSGHRRFQGRRGHRDPGQARRYRQPRSSRWSRSNRTRRRWKFPRPRPAW